MHVYTIRTLAGDLHRAGPARAVGFNQQADPRTADVHKRRLPAQTERVGSSFIVITSFD
jgi:hypothetical protein